MKKIVNFSIAFVPFERIRKEILAHYERGGIVAIPRRRITEVIDIMTCLTQRLHHLSIELIAPTARYVYFMFCHIQFRYYQLPSLEFPPLVIHIV